MNEHEMETALNDLIAEVLLCMDTGEQIEPPAAMGEIDSVRTFAEAGLMTRNAGVVLRLKDRREFQVTIVQSR